MIRLVNGVVLGVVAAVLLIVVVMAPPFAHLMPQSSVALA